MELRSFTAGSRWWDGLWGSGHTLETDPSQRGWQARPSSSNQRVLIVGRPGKPGCMSVVQLGDKLDVLVYEDATPVQVYHSVNGGDRVYHDFSRLVDPISGWALPLIERIEAYHRGEIDY